MRILFFSHSFGSPTTTFIRNETNFFNENYSIKYLCSELFPSGIFYDYVYVIPFKQNAIFKKFFWWLWKLDILCFFKNRNYSRELNKFVDEFKPDIIHCNFAYESLMLLDNISDFSSRKFVVHLHGYDASKMMRKSSYVRRLKHYLKQPNVFTISCNQFFINLFQSKYNIRVNKFFVLKYGVNISDLFDPIMLKEKKTSSPYVLQVSSLVEKKGHEYTFRAFKHVIADEKYKGLKLYITGDGERKKYLKNLINELNISDSVTFLGNLKPTEVARYLANAEVFLHHSITDKDGDMEGIPNAIIEAMAMELPIVSTFHSGIPELVTDGINGYLVHERDVVKYSQRIINAMSMGKLSINRKKIAEEYSLSRHNESLVNIYTELINVNI